LKKLVVIAILLAVLLSRMPCRADTLLVSVRHPDTERLLLFRGKYFIKLQLTESMDVKGKMMLHIDEGIYQSTGKEIFFEYPDLRAGDSLKCDYFTWHGKVHEPNYNVDYEVMVTKLFGPGVASVLDGTVIAEPINEYKGLFGSFSEAGILKVGGGKKYKIEKTE
jgi:hypothetical protein